MVYKIVLLTLGILAIVEGLFILIFQKRVKNILKELSKVKSDLRKIAIIEAIIGLVILGIVLVF